MTGQPVKGGTVSDTGRAAGKGGPEEAITRRVDGFVWLAKHSRRLDIVAYVRGGRDAAPDWLKADRVWPKVQRDRAVWKAAHAGSDGGTAASLRGVSDALSVQGIDVSYQTVANVLEVYGDPSGPTPPAAKGAPRLKLKAVARKAITRDVIAQFDAGELTAVQVAELIGAGCDHRNAVYWVKRMRDLYAGQDAEPAAKPAGVRGPKKPRKRS